MLYRTIAALLWLTYSALVTAGMFLIYPELDTSVNCVMFIVGILGFAFATLCVDKVLKILLED